MLACGILHETHALLACSADVEGVIKTQLLAVIEQSLTVTIHWNGMAPRTTAVVPCLFRFEALLFGGSMDGGGGCLELLAVEF